MLCENGAKNYKILSIGQVLVIGFDKKWDYRSMHRAIA